MEKLNEKNYFSLENNIKYTGSSQIKSFISCEKAALAELTGEWKEEKSDAILVSSYVDEAISGTLDNFKEQHPEIFLKSGELKAQYKNAEEIVNKIKDDTIFYKYLQGEPQVIMTGEISGVPIKIKIDSYHKDKAIVDLKCIKDFNLIWNENTKQKEDFITYYDYILQRMFVSRGRKAKHRQKTAIYNCSLYKGKIFTEGFTPNSARDYGFEIRVFKELSSTFTRFKTGKSRAYILRLLFVLY